MKFATYSTSAAVVGLMCILLLVLVTSVATASEILVEDADLFDMSIEELMNVEIESTGTLTKTKARLVPAAITTITQEQIYSSGARNLLELLDIYVPNFQYIRQHWELDHMGLRGIINDRDDKYLLLVNGRVMNERTHYGAVSERGYGALGDIHHIDVIRGPGSALYGPGAISMVINIVTDNAKTFDGTEIGVRGGFIEEFSTIEFKHGETSPEYDAGLFFYAGISKYVGANQIDAPQIYAMDWPDRAYFPWNPSNPGPDLPGEGYEKGTTMTEMDLPNDNAQHRGLPPLKIHGEFTKGNWTAWGRYTRGGQEIICDPTRVMHFPYGLADFWGATPADLLVTSGYQQATAYVGYNKSFSDNFSLDAAFSYDLTDFERIFDERISSAHREDEFYFKALFNWDINSKHKVAFGSEYSHEEFGIGSPSNPGVPPTGFLMGEMTRWHTNMLSFLGEHQWTINDKWTTFIGGRIDNHKYCRKMYSPRVAAVFTPNNRETWKFIWSRSVRTNFAEEMRIQALNGNNQSTPEKLDSVEIRYEKKQSKNLDLAFSGFLHYELDLISWNGSESAPVGTQRDWGFELEAAYHTEKTTVSFSHSYTQLYGFDLIEGMSTMVTATPQGYGNDLANWANQTTKIVVKHKLNSKVTVDGSLRIYWNFPGKESYDDYTIANPGFPLPAIDEDWEAAYRGNYYLNLGIELKHSENLTLRMDGYNLLGIFDKDLNKRNYLGGPGDYRCHSVGIGLWAIYKFK